MSGAELGLGIIGAVATVHVAIKACKRVAETCSAYKQAEAEINERSIRLQSNCLQILKQLEIFSQIEHHLDVEGQTIQTQVLEVLISKLAYADSKLKGLESDWLLTNPCTAKERSLNKRVKASYVVQKSSLDKAINDVESWQRLSFNPLWFEITRWQTSHFDKKLTNAKENNSADVNEMITTTIVMRNPLKHVNSINVFLPPGRLDRAQIANIAFSSIKSVQVDGKWRIMDSTSDLSLSKSTARELAVRLKGASPVTFGLLTCLGAVHDQRSSRISFIFRMPETMSQPETLRAKIMASNSIHSLSGRFRVATQLARAVSSIHTFDIVHKSIRPENIILFQDPESELGSAFLLGFEAFRRGDDSTRLSGDTDLGKNLYRHPQRQGAKIQDRYIMQHDIYSLGVCLLEIGLWTSFVEYTADQTPTRSQAYDFSTNSFNNPGHPETVKANLLTLTTEVLPGKMGTKYAKIVESCLSCLDLGNEDFGDEKR